MFAVLGVAGLWALQRWAEHRDKLQQHTKSATKTALQSVVGLEHRDSSTSLDSADERCSRSSRSKSSPCHSHHQAHHGRLNPVRDGAFICFKDRTGQIAVTQPYGNGGSWQLTVTCASGGCCMTADGAGSLSYIHADGVFLVHQVGNSFAFQGLGAEGRYLSAARDLSAPPVVDSLKLSPAAQWKVTSQGITNAQHHHKKLSYTIHEVRAVPVEAITALERSINLASSRQQDRIAAAESTSRSLQSQLHDAKSQLSQAKADHATEVQEMTDQLSEALMFNGQLTALIEAKDEKMNALREHVNHTKCKYQEAERELATAYSEVTSLQQQLAERDEDVQSLQDRMCSETKQWGQLRSALQDSLQRKDEEIASLSLQVQRMEAALRAVERTLYGMRRPRQLDRASLDAVSIHQLQAAVDNFAAVGDSGLMMMTADPNDAQPSQQQAEALRVLFESHQAAAGLDFAAFELDAGVELSTQDLDLNSDQTSPGKQTHLMGDVKLVRPHAGCGLPGQVGPTYSAAAAEPFAAGDAALSRLARRTSQTGAATGSAALASAAGSSGKANWSAGAAGGAPHSRNVPAGRGCLVSTWSHPDDGAVGNSRGARSSATSEEKHRYSGDCSDAESQDDGLTAEASYGEGEGFDEDAAAADMVCHSMDEQEMQQQMGKLKASASQFPSSRSRSAPAIAEVLAGQPLHAHLHQLSRPHPGTTASLRQHLSMSQLSPVIEEKACQPPRCMSSTGV